MWWQQARCLGEPLEVFYSPHAEDKAKARRLCAACPVALQCLESALREELNVDEFGPHGYRGGMTARERRRLIMRARRQRR